MDTTISDAQNTIGLEMTVTVTVQLRKSRSNSLIPQKSTSKSTEATCAQVET